MAQTPTTSPGAGAGSPAAPGQEAISSRSQQKADASKSFLEQHYMGMLRSMKYGQEARPVNKPRVRELGAADFEIKKLIGRGAFGEVFICSKKEDEEEPGKLYAMKRMSKAEMFKKKKIAHVRSENNIMAHAARESPWIVVLHYSFQDEKYLYMIMDYMPGGDMMTWLCNEGTFSVDATRFYIAELALSVHSVHEREYVHRDIKPDNILMDANGHTKLSDFGLCKAFPKQGEQIVDLYNALELESSERGDKATTFKETEPFDSEPKRQGSTVSPSGSPAPAPTSAAPGSSPAPATSPASPLGGSGVDGSAGATSETAAPTRAQRRVQFNSLVGSPGYIAPEILNRQPYTQACDWWSVGVIMYEMLYGRTPFYHADPQKTGYMICHWKEHLRFPQGRGVPEVAVDLMKKLLCAQDDRIGFDEIKPHPFFKGIDWENQQNSPPVFVPILDNPLDVRYFPPQEELVRPTPASPPGAKDTGADGLATEDPRGVLFADFRYDRRQHVASTKRSVSK